jgi:hypothetical protein
MCLSLVLYLMSFDEALYEFATMVGLSVASMEQGYNFGRKFRPY